MRVCASDFIRGAVKDAAIHQKNPAHFERSLAGCALTLVETY
jgi:hypothetical protein